MRRNIRAKPDVASRFPGGSACAHRARRRRSAAAHRSQLRGRLSAAAAAADGEYQGNDELFVDPDFGAPRLKARQAEKSRGGAQVLEQAVKERMRECTLLGIVARTAIARAPVGTGEHTARARVPGAPASGVGRSGWWPPGGPPAAQRSAPAPRAGRVGRRGG
ncbi:hypothetical protein OG369_40200 [Streptomyces sp. NBC_01221]|uniref:hypothetical protein n=1 Tax=unclassified Streptomyces TaxID=2593676 RepID=UPI002255EA25|nr:MULTISPECIES: hypothetical protein [unclassified Streptomyces]MCX4792069.1 hypothetical protein [Streptomyces sp. NBC_01221]WSJ40594.1 hypothetical protein OG772_34680 [Streptomyces sp. NBC_01321]